MIDINVPIVEGLYNATIDMGRWMLSYGIPLAVGTLCGWMMHSARHARWKAVRK